MRVALLELEKDEEKEKKMEEKKAGAKNATTDNFLCELLSSDGLVKDTTCRISYTFLGMLEI